MFLKFLTLSLVSMLLTTTTYASEFLELTPEAYTSTGTESSEFLILGDVKETESSSAKWQLQKGSLRAQLREWAALGGYQIVWSAIKDYQIDASATFTGNFLDVFTSVMHSLRQTGTPIKAQIYTGNKVIVIREG